MRHKKSSMLVAMISSLTATMFNYSPVFSQSASFVGCWRGSTPPAHGIIITDTHIFKNNGEYEATRGGSPIASLNGKWSGNWSHDEGYIIVTLDTNGTRTFQLISSYEMRQVGSAVRYSRC